MSVKWAYVSRAVLHSEEKPTKSEAAALPDEAERLKEVFLCSAFVLPRCSFSSSLADQKADFNLSL